MNDSDDLVQQMFGGMFQMVAGPLFMSDAEMFAGLPDRTVVDLKRRLQSNPDLRPLLCQGALMRRSKTPQKNTRPEFVYFIQAELSGLVKIGCASDPAKRLATLKTGSPEPLRLLAVITGGQAQEQVLHRQFANTRSHGEWFLPSSELFAYIQDVAA